MKKTETNFNPQNKNLSDEEQKGFIEKYRNWIIGISVAVIVIVGGLYFMKTQQREEARQASVALGRIMTYYESGEYEKALNGDPNETVRGEKIVGLTEITKKYSGSDQAEIAALYAGNAYVKLGDFAAAKEYFIKAQGADSKLVRTGAESGLGLVAESNTDYEEAAKHYMNAAEESGMESSAVRYKYYAGLCYEKLDKADKAESVYREILDGKSDPEFTNLAKNGLARIGTIIE